MLMGRSYKHASVQGASTTVLVWRHAAPEKLKKYFDMEQEKETKLEKH